MKHVISTITFVVLCAAVDVADTSASVVEETPAIGEFKLLASRRFVLDNELKLAELLPGTVMVPGVQHPLVWSVDGMPPQVAFENGIMRLSAPDRPAEGAFFVSGWLPGAHYSADFESLSAGAAAVLVWRDEKEDPYFMFDETTNKWRFATSTFAEKGLSPSLIAV